MARKPNPKPEHVHDYLALLDLVVPYNGATIIDGQWLDEDDRSQWHQVQNVEVAAGVILKAGTRFTADIGNERRRVWVRIGVIASHDAVRHFELEDVFDMDAPGGNRSTVADVLRLHQITTLEQVAENANGSQVYGEYLDDKGKSRTTPISVHDILAGLFEEAEVKRLMRQALKLIEDEPEESGEEAADGKSSSSGK